ncbi:UDP-2,3-diacylglucosamine diphosphatase [Methylophaga sp. OBS1]|jgi:UDP-2,3-diacylglucosamine pyrophosphatase LpxH|uniref:UDP-2,3-diacylglucosamine diphosphatase n=1 Tax=Methylophaga sp. OBS1 TaxID=2991933 RepID=UPI00225AA82F|nr:UDP-2,3-diacylglucosamine diphosphatase [Methylophaga sp. OBS1]MCX4193675.1 UDP-2,3-diacylglucosamine diphosphatase [Methylophaga sp. OBS1]
MQKQVSQKEKIKVRSVWISDIHLGFRGCSADFLLDFLHKVECDYLYLVGDIIDVWEMKKKMFWPQAHNNVIRTLLGKAKHNTKVIYVPGNHDEMLRDYDGAVFGNVEIQNEVIHTTADNRKLLILHGDQFDSVVKISPLLAKVGSRLYEWLLRANRYVNLVRRKLGFSYWSLAAFLKHKVKNAVQYISNFEEAVAHEAARQGVDGVVCGHIHRAEIARHHNVDYYNCGDWVESCTALVEHPNGEMEILYWTDLVEQPQALVQAA